MVLVFALGLCGGRLGVTVLFGVISFLALREMLTLTPTRRGDHHTLFWAFFVMVPIHNLLAVSAAEFDAAMWQRCVPFAEGRLASAYLYCRGGVNHLARFHARMFAPEMGISEDPATGAACRKAT